MMSREAKHMPKVTQQGARQETNHLLSPAPPPKHTVLPLRNRRKGKGKNKTHSLKMQLQSDTMGGEGFQVSRVQHQAAQGLPCGQMKR
jgi:hypothetical protein